MFSTVIFRAAEWGPSIYHLSFVNFSHQFHEEKSFMLGISAVMKILFFAKNTHRLPPGDVGCSF